MNARDREREYVLYLSTPGEQLDHMFVATLLLALRTLRGFVRLEPRDDAAVSEQVTTAAQRDQTVLASRRVRLEADRTRLQTTACSFIAHVFVYLTLRQRSKA